MTLIELLTATALILFILVILTEAFGTALQSFRQLKALGDLDERLRGLATALRHDLAADHFEGKRRLSDPGNPWRREGPREGFFRLVQGAGLPADDEGRDADGLESRRRTGTILHFSIKLRGNERADFVPARVKRRALLLTQRTNFFRQPADARYQDDPDAYHSQWAEVAYFLEPSDARAGTTPLYLLYRTRLVVVADNSVLNPLDIPPTPPQLDLYAEVSCQPDRSRPTPRLHFNCPSDLVRPLAGPPENRRASRAFDPINPTRRGATLLLTDVLSFDVQALTGDEFTDASFDTATQTAPIRALKITLRAWDGKTRQSRQMTLVQDL